MSPYWLKKSLSVKWLLTQNDLSMFEIMSIVKVKMFELYKLYEIVLNLYN